MKKRISIIIVAALMAFTFAIPVAADSYTASYSVSADKTLSRKLGGNTAYHYFDKGGVIAADYIAVARMHNGKGDKMTATLSITSSNGKTNKVTYYNTYANSKSGVNIDLTKSNTKTKGTLWKSTTKTSAVLKSVYGTATNTWTVTGK